MRAITFVALLSCLILRVVAQSPVWGQCGGIGWCVLVTSTCFSRILKASEGVVLLYVPQGAFALNSTTVWAFYHQIHSQTIFISIFGSDHSQCLPVSTSSTSAPTTTSKTTSSGSSLPPTTTSSGPTPTGSQIRSVNDPVYHFYLQSHSACFNICLIYIMLMPFWHRWTSRPRP
jgi:hypothetical protein